MLPNDKMLQLEVEIAWCLALSMGLRSLGDLSPHVRWLQELATELGVKELVTPSSHTLFDPDETIARVSTRNAP